MKKALLKHIKANPNMSMDLLMKQIEQDICRLIIEGKVVMTAKRKLVHSDSYE